MRLIIPFLGVRSGGDSGDVEAHGERLYRLLEKHVSALFYGVTFISVVFYFIVVSIVAGASRS